MHYNISYIAIWLTAVTHWNTSNLKDDVRNMSRG